jgi:predicted membrane channel-forming protein YqfA (hemolysin III family)
MFFSTIFHTLRDQGPKESLLFLKFDLIGIVAMIFCMGIVFIWIVFSDWQKERMSFEITISVIFLGNFIISFTPCYTNHKYEKMRVALNVFTILSIIIVGGIWAAFYATGPEIKRFLPQFSISLAYLIIGFIFYRTRFPEAYLTTDKCGKKVAYLSQIFF